MVILSSEEFKEQIDFSGSQGEGDLMYEINLQSNRGFDNEGITPKVETALDNNEYIGYLMIEDEVAASGFGRIDSQEGSEYKTMYLHSISVAEKFRGQGLCKKITDEFIKKFGKDHILYLTVRTQKDNENTSGIKCYEKNGFILLPQVYRDHYDGKNSAMIRLPTISQLGDSNRKKKRRKKTRNKRK